MNIFKSFKSKVEASATGALRKEFQPEIDELRARADEFKAKADDFKAQADRAEKTLNDTAEEARKTMKSVRRNGVLAVIFTGVAAVASVTAAIAACRK